MRNESNTITGRTCQMSGNTSSRMHSGDVSRNRRIVVRRQKIALVSVAFIALATIICIFLSGAVRTQAAPSEISCKYYTSIEVQSGDTLSLKAFLRMRSMRDNILPSHITAVLPLQGNKIGLRIITGTRCE